MCISLDEDFQIDAKSTLRSLSSRAKILFCCSPNNPTGNLLDRDDILGLCNKFSGLIVVDEAYIEFADGQTLAGEVSKKSNLLVLRTLSKAWGLAGARCGYCIADPAIISYLFRIKAPYNMNAVTARLACEALDNESFFRQAVHLVASERERISRHLKTIPLVTRVYPSDANFLLVEFHDPDPVFQALYRQGIVVRRRSELRLGKCLRITIGTTRENNLVLETLERTS